MMMKEDDTRMKDVTTHVYGFQALLIEHGIVGKILVVLDTAVHSYLLADQYTSHVALGATLRVPLRHSNVQSIL